MVWIVCFFGGGNNRFAGWGVASEAGVDVLVDDSSVHDDWGVGVAVLVDNWGADVDVSPSTSGGSTPMGVFVASVTLGPGVAVHGVGPGGGMRHTIQGANEAPKKRCRAP